MGAVSEAAILAPFRRLLVLRGWLECCLWALVGVAALAAGPLEAPLAPVVWAGGLLLGGLLYGQARRLRELRVRVGAQRVGLHASGRWLVLAPAPGHQGLVLDLGRPLVARSPFLVAGVALALLVLGRVAVGASPPGAIQTVALLASALLAHASVLALVGAEGGPDPTGHPGGLLARPRTARRRVRRGLVVVGFALVLVLALLEEAPAWGSRLARVAGLLGAVLDRPSLAGVLLVSVPAACAGASAALAHLRRRAGTRTNLRRKLVALSSPEGIALARGAVPALVCTAALVWSRVPGAVVAVLVLFAVVSARSLGRSRPVLGPALGLLLLFGAAWLAAPQLRPALVGGEAGWARLLAQTGPLGPALVMGALLATLWSARRDAWLPGALLGIAAEELLASRVEAPAVALLVAVLAALAPARPGHPVRATAQGFSAPDRP